MTGFISLHRKLLEWEWWEDHNTTRLFVYFLLKANWKDKKWRGKIIKRGSFVTSYAKIQNETGLTQRQIRTSLNKLKTTSEVTSKATSKNTLVTVVKYDLYQIDELKTTSKTTSKETNERQTNDKQTTTTNKDNNINNINNIITPYSPPKGELVEVPDFIDYEVWDDWIKHRREIKKALKPTTAKQQIKKLTKWHESGYDVNQIILNSISNGWTGLFEPKEKQNDKNAEYKRDIADWLGQ